MALLFPNHIRQDMKISLLFVSQSASPQALFRTCCSLALVKTTRGHSVLHSFPYHLPLHVPPTPLWNFISARLPLSPFSYETSLMNWFTSLSIFFRPLEIWGKIVFYLFIQKYLLFQRLKLFYKFVIRKKAKHNWFTLLNNNSDVSWLRD